MHDELDELSDEFLAELQAGHEPDPEAYARDHPHLAEPLGRRLESLLLIHGVARSDSESGAIPSHLLFPLGEGLLPSGEELPSAISRFEILSLVGRGTFGAVYKARDPELDRIVAVKIPRAGAFISPREEERFLREARSAARLRHPGIVQVHEIGQENGVPFLVTQFVEGSTLARRIEERRPPPREAALLVQKIALALAAAHEQGIVHRDVKPGNILMDPEGEPLVSDFGLARLAEGDITMTQEGQLLGTPAYMAPEQAAGEQGKVGPRSDIFSLGVVLYELLTGERPFRGSKSMVVWQVTHEEPRPPRALNDQVPRDIETICLKAMAKEIVRRYSDARELAEDLARFLRGEPIQARPVGRIERFWRWAHRNPALAGLAALLLVTVATALIVLSVAIARTSRARDEAHLRYQRLNVASGSHQMDQGDLAGSLHWHVEALRLDQGDPERERVDRIRYGTTLAHCPRLLKVLDWSRRSLQQFSPDGRLLAQVSHEGCTLSSALTNRDERRLKDWVPMMSKVLFSPDSKLLLAFGRPNKAVLYDVETGDRLLDSFEHASEIRDADFSSDGARILTAGADRTLAVWDRAAGENTARRLFTIPHDHALVQAAFSGDGRLIASVSEGRITRIWEADGGELLWTLDSQTVSFQLSPDGRRIAILKQDQSVRLFDLTTGKHIPPPLGEEPRILQFAFGPDGRRFAMADAESVYLRDARTNASLFAPVSLNSLVSKLAFGPNGRHLFASTEDGLLRRFDAWTGAELGHPVRHPRPSAGLRVHPNGHSVLSLSADGLARLWSFTREEPGVSFASRSGAFLAMEPSPDGRFLATASLDSQVRLWSCATLEPQGPSLKHPANVGRIAFSPDGVKVITLCHDGNGRVWNLSSAEPAFEWELGGRFTGALAVSPDGKLFACAGEKGVLLIETRNGAEEESATLERTVERLLLKDPSAVDLEFSPDGRRLLVSGSVSPVRIVAVPSGEILCELEKSFRPKAARFLGSGERFLVVEHLGTASIHDSKSGALAARALEQGGSTVAKAILSPTRSQFLHLSHEGSARVYDSRTAQPASRRFSQRSTLTAGAFSPDGRLVATGSVDGFVRVWDWKTGEEVSPPLRHSLRVAHLGFHPAGGQVMSGSLIGEVKFWRIRSDDRPLQDLSLLAELLTGRRLDPEADNILTLRPEVLLGTWESLHQKYPEEFAVDPDEEFRWNARGAEEAETSGEWFAALWHLERLEKLKPETPWRHRIDGARAKLEEERSDKPRLKPDPRDLRLALSERELLFLPNVSAAELVRVYGEKGMRIADLEVLGSDPPTLSAVLVKNSGVHASGWYFYYQQTRRGLLQLFEKTGTYPLDIEPYELNGSIVFAATLLAAHVEERARYVWRSNLTALGLLGIIAAPRTRVMDLDAYQVKGQTRFSVILRTPREGEVDPSWTHIGLTAEGVDSKIREHEAQLYDIETYLENGERKFAAVLVPRDQRSPLTISWRWGLSPKELESLLDDEDLDPIDIEPYREGKEWRYAAVLAPSLGSTRAEK